MLDENSQSILNIIKNSKPDLGKHYLLCFLFFILFLGCIGGILETIVNYSSNPSDAVFLQEIIGIALFLWLPFKCLKSHLFSEKLEVSTY